MTPLSTRLPQGLARTTLEVHGEAGRVWLDRFPELLARCAARWSLRLEAPYAPLTYHYVTRAWRADGSPVVLKLGVPHPELTGEIEALRLYAGAGAVRLLGAEPDDGALLLERLEPGTTLLDLPDEEATTLAAGVMRRLRRPLPSGHPFPAVEQWAEGLARLRHRFGGGTGPLPSGLVARAESHFRELLATSGEPVLLHADLHHWNVLSASGEWRAIDPKGLAGEAEYETGAWLRNPLPGLLGAPDLPALLRRRIEIFHAELGFDPQRVRAWAVAQAVLSAWWSVEDHGSGWEPAVAVAEGLAAIGG
ncbi:MAG: aminoglycoside phosphotransferase family protein [Armatimonadota bacterium]